MKKQLVLVIIAMLVIGFTVWLVRSEGQRFRTSMREEASAAIGDGLSEAAEQVVEKAGEESGELVDQVVEGAERVIDNAAAASGQILRDLGQIPRDEEPVSSPDSVPANRPVPEPNTQDAIPVQSNSQSEPPREEREETDPQDAAKPDQEPSDLTSLVGDLFAAGRKITRTVDEVGQQVLGLSVQEELQLGRQVNQEIRQQHNIARSPAQMRRLRLLAAPLLKDLDRRTIEFQLTILDDDEINAFAHLGGYLYFNTGLLDLVEDDSELQFVIAHEIAHVELKHCVNQLVYAARAYDFAGEAGSTLASLAYQLISLGYSEENELEADEWAFRRLIQLGNTRDESLAIIRRLGRRIDREGAENTSRRAENPLDAVVQEIDNHLRTHPPMKERVERLENLEL